MVAGVGGRRASRPEAIHDSCYWQLAHAEGELTGASRPEAIHDSCYPQRARIEPGPKLAESGSMILTAQKASCRSLAGIRLGGSRAVPRTRPWAQPGASRLREAIRPDRSGTCSHDTFFHNPLVPLFEFYHTLYY